MDEILISKINQEQDIPYNLLLLADPSEEAIRYYLDRGFCYVAYLNNKVLGAYVLLPTRPFTLELVNLVVDSEYQAMGYGKKLIAHSISTARDKGYKVLEVGTGNSSIGQLALYQKCGFTIGSVEHNFFEKYYSDPIYENGIRCSHMIRLTIDL